MVSVKSHPKSAVKALLLALRDIGKQLPKETNPVMKALGREGK